MQPWVDKHPLVCVLSIISLSYITVSIVIRYVGGWASLSKRFRLHGKFTGSRWWGQSAQMRWIASYRACLVVGANEVGLYLATLPFFPIGHPPLLVPWSEVSQSKRRLIFFTMVRFQLGREPAVPFWVSETLAERLRNVAGKAWPVAHNE
jgi:hypothetical protein